MRDITTYILVDKDDNYVGVEYQGPGAYQTARDAARAYEGDVAVVEFTYTFEDSELVWTPDGGNIWPPDDDPDDDDPDDDDPED